MTDFWYCIFKSPGIDSGPELIDLRFRQGATSEVYSLYMSAVQRSINPSLSTMMGGIGYRYADAPLSHNDQSSLQYNQQQYGLFLAL